MSSAQLTYLRQHFYQLMDTLVTQYASANFDSRKTPCEKGLESNVEKGQRDKENTSCLYESVCISSLWAALERYYCQHHRHYHTLSHLYNMLQHFDSYKHKLSCPVAVALAIWYHDIIYNVTDNGSQVSDNFNTVLSNERLSANYFIAAFSNWLPALLIKQVTTLIMMTEKHQLTKELTKFGLEEDARYLLDIDLAILGANWQAYLCYTKQVRLEYQHIELDIFNQQRRMVLEQFLQRERLYFTDEFYAECEQQARHNLTKEIKRL